MSPLIAARLHRDSKDRTFGSSGICGIHSPGVFVNQHAWLTGSATKDDCPVAFAADVEARHHSAGNARVRPATGRQVRALAEVHP